VGIPQKLKIFPEITNDMIKDLKVLMLAGGEPLLIKENKDLLTKLLAINPNCSIQVTTNLTTLNTPVYELLKQFENVKLVVSFEAVGEQYEYIRFGSKWNTFLDNFKQATKDFAIIQTNMVFFPLSMIVIDQAIDLALTFIPEDNIFVVCQYGNHLPSFDSINKNIIKKYVDKLTNFAYIKTSQSLKDKILASVQSMHSSADITKLNYYDEFDKLTNQNHRIIFKELY
jgi:organic radical activating enzyme